MLINVLILLFSILSTFHIGIGSEWTIAVSKVEFLFLNSGNENSFKV